MKIKLTKTAQSQLVTIKAYSGEKWGSATAEEYMQGLLDSIERLSAHPRIASSCEDISKGLRCKYYRSHAIYYRIYKNYFGITNIIHQHSSPVLHIH